MAYQSPPSSISPGLTFGTYPATGRNTHFFQPPTSPASTASTPSFATPASDQLSSGTRKRSRPTRSIQVGKKRGSPVGTATVNWDQCATTSDGTYTGAYGTNSVSVNEKYSLAGGLDTPGLQATADMEQMQLGSIGNDRRWRGDSNRREFSGRLPSQTYLSRERNGAPRVQSSSDGEFGQSWAGMAFSLVGKVFSFGSTVFRGFYAGGGKGYDMNQSNNIWMSQDGCSTPLPGAWRDEFFDVDVEPEETPLPERPPKKRRQADREAWVMIDTPDVESSPKRKVSGTGAPRLHAVQTTAQVPSQSTTQNPSARSLASRAPNRRSLAPISHRWQSSHASNPGSPAQLAPPSTPDRRASFAPMRSGSRPSSSSNNNLHAAYVSPEIERYMKRRDRHDRRADAAMGDMSRKLAELIKQGQAALGTKFEVEDDYRDDDVYETDEGYVDEEW
ncbi:hypothetical protein KC363_g7485 [Hortaea werneckii]|uniref:Uncharacterized protein n=1 Tax=Hortaea werneckii TaxID=91943 RepID=A0A3M7F6T8_HORWE|nr:hypothetical protein KC361_g8036 [Hortaea werneckii]KAI7184847.1 hypothetical protein KC363_g7485 [Hortaea werneckii]KAI7504344.1 hypothetical protein KC347_g8371 [Hortaea werneckii]RMY84559.1 hypothetical protein D0861_06899 [Hortaea werneckii]